MSVAHTFTWLFGLQGLTELKACAPLALYHSEEKEQKQKMKKEQEMKQIQVTSMQSVDLTEKVNQICCKSFVVENCLILIAIRNLMNCSKLDVCKIF